MKAEIEAVIASAAAKLKERVEAGEHDAAALYARILMKLHAIWQEL